MADSKSKISTELELTGEKKFRDAVKSINSEMSLLSAQMKESAANMTTNGTTAERVTQHLKLMQQMIGESREKVKTLSEALSTNADNQSKINSAIENAKGKQEELAAAVERTRKEFGKNSEEAKAARRAYDENQSSIVRLETALAREERAERSFRIQLANAETQLHKNVDAMHKYSNANGVLVGESSELDASLKGTAAKSKELSEKIKALSSSYSGNGGKLKNLLQQQKAYNEQIANSLTKINALKIKIQESESNYESLKKTLDETAKKFGENSVETKAAANELKKAESEVTKYKIQLSQAKTELASSKKALIEFNNENGKLKITKAFKAGKDSVKEFTESVKLAHPHLTRVAEGCQKVALATAAISAEAAKISFKTAEKSVEAFGDTIKKSMELGVNAVGAYTKALAASTAAVGVLSVKTGLEFDKQMSTVQALTGATGEEFDKLSQKAKDLGKTTVFSAAEVGKAMEYMGMAGWGTEDIQNGIQAVMDLAAASGEDIGTVSDIVTDAMTAFGMQANEAAHFANVLAKAATDSNTNVAMMGDTFKYVAPLAGTLGYSIDDMAVAIGLMANQGIKGSQAGTALKNIISNMAAPTEAMGNAMDELGVSLTDENGSMLSFADTLSNLRSGFAKFQGDEAKQAQLAKDLAGKYGMAGLLAIVNSTDSDVQSLTNSFANATDAAKNMADIKLDNLSGDITILKSAVSGAAIDISDRLSPALRTATQGVTELVNAFSTGGIEGFLKTLSVKLPQALSFVSSAIDENFPKIATAFNGVLLTIANSLPEIMPSVINTVIPTLTGGATELALGMVDLLPTLLPQITKAAFELFNGILLGFNEVVDELNKKIPETVPKIGAQLVNLSPILLKNSIQLFGGIVTGLTQTTKELTPYLPQLIKNLCETIKSNIPQMIQAGIELFSALSTAIQEVLPVLVAELPQIITTTVTELTKPENLESVFQSAADLFSCIAAAVPDVLISLGEALPTIVTNISEFLTNTDTLGQIFDSAVEMLIQIVRAIPKIIIELIRALPSVVTKVKDFLTDPKSLKKVFKSAVTLLCEIIKAIGEVTVELVKNLPEIIDGLKGFFSDPEQVAEVFQIGVDLLMCIADGISSVKDTLLEVAGEVLDALIEKAKTWGSDLIESFLNGIEEKWDEWVSTMGELGEVVYDMLHHSHPETGLLKDDYTWMPDMIDSFVKGIHDNKGKLFDEVESVATGISKGLSPEYNIDMPKFGKTAVERVAEYNASRAANSGISNTNSNNTYNIPVYVTVNANGNLNDSGYARRTAEMLARETQYQLAGIGLNGTKI